MQTKEELLSLGLNEKESQLLSELLKGEMFFKEDYVNNNLQFDLSQYEFCEIFVILKNAVLNTEFSECEWISFDEAQINKTGNGYSLTADACSCDLENDKNIPFQLCIDFESVEIKSKSLKSTFNVFENETPWESLTNYAYAIYEKVKRPYLAANEREKALAPLLKDFYVLSSRSEQSDNITLDVLKNTLPEDKKLNKLFRAVEQSKSAVKRDKAINHLFSYISCGKFEDCWRSILDLLNASQSGYEEENKSEIYNKLTDKHNYIDEIMKLNGYEGTYPTYEKHTEIKGIHLQKNRNDLYFAGMEPVSIFVECKDYISDSFGNIEFQISTILGAANEIRDKYSSLFAKKGKGYYKTEHIMYEISESGDIQFESDSEQIPHIVCKQAEFKKLSKEEKKICGLV